MAHGKLAAEFGFTGLDVKVLKSEAGWYIGTYDEEFGAVSRESEEYWNTKPEADRAFHFNKWTQRTEENI